MPRLITPVQYEDVLADLNVVRPLELTDEVKVGLEIPVLKVSPVSDCGVVDGRLLSCDKNGALINRNSGKFKNYQTLSFFLYDDLMQQILTFNQMVFYVMWIVTNANKATTVHWTNSDYSVNIQSLSVTGSTGINFKGTDLPLKLVAGVDGYIIGDLYGFYN